jgi:hypothetical protein
MRRLTFLLCLLMVVALRWIIGSATALTTMEQNEALLRKTDLNLEAVNTGFKAGLVAVSIREDTAWIADELPSAVVDAGAHSTTANLSRPNRRVELEFIENAAGRLIENLPQTSACAYRPRRIYL